jgi:hypothetical protein
MPVVSKPLGSGSVEGVKGKRLPHNSKKQAAEEKLKIL